VQWGLPYGVSNRGGMTPKEIVAAILAEAQRKNITVLDTASLYGEAEAVLGQNSLAPFRVITKTPKFATPVITGDQVSFLFRTFQQSLDRLSVSQVYGLLIHHADDLLVGGGEKLVAAMTALKDKGEVRKIGVSVYDGEQIDAVLRVFRPDIVQLPISVLDQRLLTAGKLARLKDEGVEIHARSVFLQGLLLMTPDEAPEYFSPLQPLLRQWHAAAKVQGMTPIQAALAFVRDIAEIDIVLVGVETVAQFRSCVEDFAMAPRFDSAGLACNDPHFVNPALWKTR